MHRFFVDKIEDNRVLFSANQSHQLARVLRLYTGDRVVALDNSGYEYETIMTRVDKKAAVGKVVEKRPSPNEPTTQLTLYISLIKWERFEWALQKGTELGAAHFAPVISRHTSVQGANAVNPNRLGRWERIVTEAAEQSRRGRVPTIAPPVKLTAAMAAWEKHDLVLMPALARDTVSIRAALPATPPASAAIVVGPEGGFTPDEITNGRLRNASLITLGRRVLRAETAVVAAASIVMYELENRK